MCMPCRQIGRLGIGAALCTVLWTSALNADELFVIKPKFELSGHEHVDALAFSPSGKTLAVASGDIHIWDPETGTRERVLRQKDGGVSTLAFIRGGDELISSGGLGRVRIWNLAKGEDRIVLEQPGYVNLSVAPDGHTLALNAWVFPGGSYDMELRDLDAGRPKRTVESKSSAVVWTFSADGHTLLAGYEEGQVKLFDVETAKLRTAFLADERKYVVNHVRCSPDGRTLAVSTYPPDVNLNPRKRKRGENGQIVVWDMMLNEKLATVLGDDVFIDDIQFSPNGELLAVTSSFNVKLWNVRTRTMEAKLVGDGRLSVSCVAFSPDGKLLAGGTVCSIRRTKDPTLKIWELSAKDSTPGE